MLHQEPMLHLHLHLLRRSVPRGDCRPVCSRQRQRSAEAEAVEASTFLALLAIASQLWLVVVALPGTPCSVVLPPFLQQRVSVAGAEPGLGAHLSPRCY